MTSTTLASPQDYLFGTGSFLDICKKYKIRSDCQLSKWIKDGCFRILSAAAEADNLKLHHIQFQIISTKRKICVFTILAQMLPFVFSSHRGQTAFYSLGTAVRRKLQVSRGMQFLWLWVSNRGEKRPVGTRFCLQSLVCYTFCDR